VFVPPVADNFVFVTLATPTVGFGYDPARSPPAVPDTVIPVKFDPSP